MTNLPARKFYEGNLMMCIDKENKKSSTYIKDALFFKLSNGTYFHIEDGIESDLTQFVCLIPETSLEGRTDIYKSTPEYDTCIYVDEESLHPYGIIKEVNQIKK